MKNDKLPGSDEVITVEALKYDSDFLHSAILDIKNTALNQKETPKQWRENIIIPIPKKASKHMKDFRGTTLVPIAEKVLSAI